MDYGFFVSIAQGTGLALIGGSAVALLRLLLVHYVQHDWSADKVNSLHLLTGAMAAGLLLFAFSGGGWIATRLFQTNTLPGLPMIAVHATLVTVLAASAIFLHVVAGPWLAGETEGQAPQPLVMSVSAHRCLAMTLAMAALFSAWLLWLVLALATPAPHAAAVLASLALMTLVVWSLLALPALLLRAMAVHALRPEDVEETVPMRIAPALPEVPQHHHAHVPAPRAPRPRLMMRGDGISG